VSLAAGAVVPKNFIGFIELNAFVGYVTDDGRAGVATPYGWTNADLVTVGQPFVDACAGAAWRDDIGKLFFGIVCNEPATAAAPNSGIPDFFFDPLMRISRYRLSLIRPVSQEVPGQKHPWRQDYLDVIDQLTTDRDRILAGTMELPGGLAAVPSPIPTNKATFAIVSNRRIFRISDPDTDRRRCR